MAFTSQTLLERLEALTAGAGARRWVVAFSGGIDSTVLLHALAAGDTSRPILAVHIDHGLHPDSARWAEHCESVARDINVAFLLKTVSVPSNADSGPEAAARQARYAALSGIVEPGDCVLSAHHEDDQAETLLLNLMRGSGPAGLAGIGARQAFGRGLLLRPMLGVAGPAIEDYAATHGLSWIDDPANEDSRFDRNFLRSEILPRLAARWPAVSNRLRRSAELLGESGDLLSDLADIDLLRAGPPDALSIPAMTALSPARQRNLLRRAVRLCGLPSPPATSLHRIIHEMIPARPDARPLVEWEGAEVRRYRECLYLMPVMASTPPSPGLALEPGGAAVELGDGLGSLALVRSWRGIDPAVAARGLEIHYREGGEAIRPFTEGPTRKLKKLMQEAAILPWMRDRIPVLHADGRVVAIADLWIDADIVADDGFAVRWVRKPAIHQRSAL